jgi:hypothetical protein
MTDNQPGVRKKVTPYVKIIRAVRKKAEEVCMPLLSVNEEMTNYLRYD